MAQSCSCIYLLYAYLHAFGKGKLSIGWLTDHAQSSVAGAVSS